MRLLAFAGSLRSGSYNRKLLHVGIGVLAGKAVVDHLDLRDVPLPLYDGDLEEKEGLPEGAVRLRQRIAGAAGLLIATPEYNHSIPGTLKNAIDWASRGPDQPFRGKVVLLMGASPGPWGAVRGVIAARQALTALLAMVLPQTVQVARAGEAFDPSGALVDPKLHAQVEKACAELVRVATALRG
ncbi:MAG: NADPH-dependent FMN reductase [Candidatus Polarisedimenticolia bacterium]